MSAGRGRSSRRTATRLAARSGSTWIHWWSPVASANALIRSWETSSQSLGASSSPMEALRSSMPVNVRIGRTYRSARPPRRVGARSSPQATESPLGAGGGGRGVRLRVCGRARPLRAPELGVRRLAEQLLARQRVPVGHRHAARRAPRTAAPPCGGSAGPRAGSSGGASARSTASAASRRPPSSIAHVLGVQAPDAGLEVPLARAVELAEQVAAGRSPRASGR